MLSLIDAVSSTCIRPLLFSSFCVGGGDWCFLLRGVVCAVGAVHVVAMSSDRLGIRGVSGVDVDWADGTVWSTGGPDVNQMG